MDRLVFIFLSALYIISTVNCKSLDFGSIFPFRSSKALNSPSAVQASTLANKLLYSEQPYENATLSLTEDSKLESNASILQSERSFATEKELLSSLKDSESLGIQNSTQKAPSNTDSQQESLQNSTQSSESFTVLSTSGESSVTVSNITNSSEKAVSTEDQEKVILGTKEPSTITVVTKTIYQRTVEWVGDTYTLSILMPIAAGVLFAVTIIITIATCRCIRRTCRRRRFRKRVLPDSIKSLRPSDQARLLGDCDSSDEFYG